MVEGGPQVQHIAAHVAARFKTLENLLLFSSEKMPK
jgi:hypothetical protein